MKEILRLSLPLTLWIATFSAIYGLTGIICSDIWTGMGLSLVQGRALLVACWIMATLLQVALLIILRSSRLGSSLPWVRHTSSILAGIAVVATAWSLLPVIAASLCR